MTSQRNYLELLQGRRRQDKRLCVGLDPDRRKVLKHFNCPDDLPQSSLLRLQYELCIQVIDETKDIAAAFKGQVAFPSATGASPEFAAVVEYANGVAPDVPFTLDCKRGDVGSTNEAYLEEVFGFYGVDAMTANPGLGLEDAAEVFLRDPNKFVYFLCKTSNRGSRRFQDRWTRLETDDERVVLATEEEPDHARSYLQVAYDISRNWSYNGNAGLVVGITYPEELAAVRRIVGPDFQILGPGAGAQGGNVLAAVQAGGLTTLVSSSSSIMFAPDIREAAEALHAELLAAEAA